MEEQRCYCEQWHSVYYLLQQHVWSGCASAQWRGLGKCRYSGSISNGDDVEYVSGVVYNGVPYVAFDDESVTLIRAQGGHGQVFDGTSWQLYAGYPDTCDIENTYLAVDHGERSLYFTYTTARML